MKWESFDSSIGAGGVPSAKCVSTTTIVGVIRLEIIAGVGGAGCGIVRGVAGAITATYLCGGGGGDAGAAFAISTRIGSGDIGSVAYQT